MNGVGLAPSDYASIGITLAQHSCAQWFSTQTMDAQATGFGAQGLALLGGVAAAAGGPVGAGAAAGASTLSALLGAAQSSFGAGANPAAIWGLISRIQAAWLAAMPVPLTTADAFALVESFSEQCSLPAIQQAVMAAMMGVPVTAASASTGPSQPVIAQTPLSPRERARPERQTNLPSSSTPGAVRAGGPVGAVSEPVSQVRIQSQKQARMQSPRQAESHQTIGPSPALRECYMNVMGCRVAIPRVEIGGR